MDTTPSDPATNRGQSRQPATSQDQRSRRGSSGTDGRGNSNKRGRGRGRGKGGPVVTHKPIASNGASTVEPAPTSISTTVSATPAAMSSEQDLEADVCFICASAVVHNSVAPCNHRTCHICALRLRALYKNNSCAHCRNTASFVIFTDDASKRFEDFSSADFAHSDPALGVHYARPDIFEDTVLLLRYNCPDPGCDVACRGWADLHRHVRAVHAMVLCELCTRHKKVFTHEHELFSATGLREHERYGDDDPGAVDQSGFKGHPDCGFCRERFYGDDELYAHCRDKHERCHICDRRGGASKGQQYFRNYDALEVHFSKDHFLCPDKECLEKKFMVFESEMDLKAHQLEAHPHGLSKDARRDARRVDMSAFDYRAPHQDERRQQQRVNRGGREGRGARGGGRGRDPNAEESLPVSSAQPMRRDELAFQREMAIHSAQSVTTRTFGGQLTSSGDAITARPPANTRNPATVTAPRSGRNASADVPSATLEDLSLPQPQTPQDRARQLRHAVVTERASNLLGASSTGLEAFRNKVSAFKSSSITPLELIESFFSLFDCSSSELGTLIKELADVFEVPGKRDSLLKAWNDWRAINEDYPSLPGMTTATNAGGGAGASGRRILKLKSSTAQSSRSAVSRHGSWGGASGSGEAFPAIANSGKRHVPGSNAANIKPTTPWTMPSAGISNRASPAPSRPQSRGPAVNGKLNGPRTSVGVDAFPALPMAQRPGMNISRPGFLGSPVRKEGSGTSTPVNAWSSSGAALAPLSGMDGEGGSGTGKGKGKKKQVLIQWG